MIEEVKVKRPRGNPNFVKKVKTEAEPVEPNVTVQNINEVNTYKYQYVESESEIWLKLFSAVIGTYNSPGPATIKAAAGNADFALKEYTSRYGEK